MLGAIDTKILPYLFKSLDVIVCQILKRQKAIWFPMPSFSLQNSIKQYDRSSSPHRFSVLMELYSLIYIIAPRWCTVSYKGHWRNAGSPRWGFRNLESPTYPLREVVLNWVSVSQPSHLRQIKS